jgi:hypothetical protein
VFDAEYHKKCSKEQLIKYQRLLLFRINSTKEENENVSLEEFAKRRDEYDKFTIWFHNLENNLTP